MDDFEQGVRQVSNHPVGGCKVKYRLMADNAIGVNNQVKCSAGVVFDG